MPTFAQAQAAEYANWAKDSGNASRVLHELVEHSELAGPLREVAGNGRFRRALEVGTGCYGLGFLAVHCADMIDEIEAIDPLPCLELALHDAALRRYVDALRSRSRYQQAKGEALPFDERSFDLVACINVVDHAESPEAILREIHRVLAPGGLLAFGVSTLSLLGEWKWRLNRWRRPGEWHFVAHPHTFQWTRADRLLRTAIGEALWSRPPSLRRRLMGRGRMSFWILRKPEA